jgi:hypothetical protein
VLVSGDADRTNFQPPASTEAALERLLRQIDSATTLDAPRSDLTRQLQFVAKSFSRRMILLVVADDRSLGDTEERLLRRLSVQHEILWLSVGDADLLHTQWADSKMHDVATAAALPMFLRADPRLRADFDRSVEERRDRNESLFARLSISSARLASSTEVVPSLLRLLEVHRHAKR